jgi:hypothetical protein
MTEWIASNKKAIIRSAFLIPIFSVATISISHVVSWYDIANPISWAIYLSIAVEIAAMSAIAASSVKVKGFSVWFVFAIVTLIQFIGNIFYSYSEIDTTAKSFRDWSELTAPILEAMGSDLSDTTAQRRWLALLEGGLLPLISLTCLHFFIKYGEIDNTEQVVDHEYTESPAETDDVQEEIIEAQPEPEKIETPDENIEEQKIDEPKIEAEALVKKPAELSHKMQKIITRK